MNSPSLPIKAKPYFRLIDLCVAGMMAALMIGIKQAIAVLPNIEMVSFLVIVFTLTFREKILPVLAVFVLSQGIIYGFNVWFIMYVYTWPMLAGLTWLFRRMKSPIGWAILSGSFGLMYGALCSIPYLFLLGPKATFLGWINGLGFDLTHCIANYIICLLLFHPTMRVLSFLKQKYL